MVYIAYCIYLNFQIGNYAKKTTHLSPKKNTRLTKTSVAFFGLAERLPTSANNQMTNYLQKNECWMLMDRLQPTSTPLFPPNYNCQICNLCVGPIEALTQSSQWLPKSATSLPKLKLTKSDGIWRSSDTTNPTSSQLPLQDHQHQCDAAGDQTTEKQQESASDQCPDENLLNLKACRDVVKNESLSSSEKHDILQKKKT